MNDALSTFMEGTRSNGIGNNILFDLNINRVNLQHTDDFLGKIYFDNIDEILQEDPYAFEDMCRHHNKRLNFLINENFDRIRKNLEKSMSITLEINPKKGKFIRDKRKNVVKYDGSKKNK